jgi:predicted esterase
VTTPAYRSLVVSRHARVAIVGDPAAAREAWLVLHGHGMLARGILHWFRAAERAGRVLVAPEALSRFYAVLTEGKRVVGASWATREDLANELDDQFAYIDRVVREIIPPGIPLQVHGFSQGVSVGARWCVRSTRQIARLVCWAGILPADVSAVALKRKLGAEPLDLVVGDRDARVLPERVEEDAARLQAAGVEVRLHRFAGGHVVDTEMLQAIAAGSRES